jgi:hypothetical protein
MQGTDVTTLRGASGESKNARIGRRRGGRLAAALLPVGSKRQRGVTALPLC